MEKCAASYDAQDKSQLRHSLRWHHVIPCIKINISCQSLWEYCKKMLSPQRGVAKNKKINESILCCARINKLLPCKCANVRRVPIQFRLILYAHKKLCQFTIACKLLNISLHLIIPPLLQKLHLTYLLNFSSKFVPECTRHTIKASPPGVKNEKSLQAKNFLLWGRWGWSGGWRGGEFNFWTSFMFRVNALNF